MAITAEQWEQVLKWEKQRRLFERKVDQMREVFNQFQERVNRNDPHNEDVVWNDAIAIYQLRWNAAKQEAVNEYSKLP